MFGPTCRKYVQVHFWKEHLCTLQVFLCALSALVSRLLCERTLARLRGNIGSNPSQLNLFLIKIASNAWKYDKIQNSQIFLGYIPASVWFYCEFWGVGSMQQFWGEAMADVVRLPYCWWWLGNGWNMFQLQYYVNMSLLACIVPMSTTQGIDKRRW